MRFECMSLKFAFSKDLSEGELQILDQTQLPLHEKWIHIHGCEQMIEAIKSLRVRGAPLIGVSAALSLAGSAIRGTSRQRLEQEANALYEARPTAVNLMICVQRMKKALENFELRNFVETAVEIYQEDIQLCDRMAENGAALIEDGDQILTHCNTGGLATVGAGTALGVIRKAHQQGKKIHVYVDETRPLLQGARLTTWELKKLNIPMTLITDNMAAQLMSLGKITKAITGADRIATNGDFANKIGTYGVAVLCHYHKIPFFVAAPYTTVDPECSNGEGIPIEQRNANEVWGYRGSSGEIFWVPPQTPVYNPSFDVTPHGLVSAWILDKSVYKQADIAKGVLRK